MYESYQGWEASVACKNVAMGDVIESWPLTSKTGRIQRKISRSFSTFVYMLLKDGNELLQYQERRIKHRKLVEK